MGAHSQRLFGTDGVRGLANVELTPQIAFDLARAAGDQIEGHVIIGADSRQSGPMLVAAVASGLNSVGVDTVNVGVLPVGAVSRLCIETGAALGVMVSASHNPAPDNGIKFFGPDGVKVSEVQERAIEARYFSDGPYAPVSGARVGTQTTMDDASKRYIDWLASTVHHRVDGMEIVVDCANGAAASTAPELFRRLGMSVDVMADTPTGENINDGVGATHPEAVAQLARGKVGLAFDGDADRLIAVDEDGEIVNGDVIMAIFAKWQHDSGSLDNGTVVATVMSNLGFHNAMEGLGIDVILTAVGDRNVVSAMCESSAVVGGEQSGHILLEDRTTGDGLRTALRLIEVMADTGQELRQLRRIMSELPQVLTNVRVGSKNGWDTHESIAAEIAHHEDKLGSSGRILVRPSGTEPLIRVMVEAPTESEAAAVAESIAAVVKTVLA
ncbi:MAG: phosphoglucosamine mutase [Actinomycetota bacterium]